ncbi:MAG TPA: GGDEF domain-containing protein [Candidatus Limnocylindrales bacterium]|nr:GGDEF domain-containing protein [Candidatus Limnocylindrales bacterium]
MTGRHAMQASARTHGWWVFAFVSLLGIALHTAVPADDLLQAVLYDVVGTAAVVAVVAGVLLQGPERRLPWLLFAAGQFLFVIGDVLWTSLELATGEIPFPSIADVAYLAGYPFLALAMVGFVRLRVRGGDRAGLLDGLILAAGASLVGWVWLVEPVLAGAAELDAVGLLVSVAYPLMDLLVIGVAFTFLATPGSRSPSFVLLVASLGIILAADVVFAAQVAEGTYVDGGLLDAGWLAGYALAGTAALHPSMRAVAQPHPVPVAWLGAVRLGGLAAAMLAGPAVLLLQTLAAGAGTPALAIGSALLGLLVLSRLALVVRLLDEDVAARRRLEAELQFQAAHDPLTGLANRRRFVAHLDAILATPRDRVVSLLFLDLDDFKTVNDSLGHAAGDQLLAVVASRLGAATRPGDLAARLGGDEFGVVLPDADAGVAAQVAERVLTSIAAPITIDAHVVSVTASVGVAERSSGETATDLIRNADLAMYQAKAAGKGRSRLFVRGASTPVAGEPVSLASAAAPAVRVMPAPPAPAPVGSHPATG